MSPVSSVKGITTFRFSDRTKNIIGWFAVIIATLLSCLWAFWGIIENFHEGWYYPSLRMNIAMMFGQYLIVPLLFILASVTAIRWPWLGGCLFVVAGGFAAWYFRGASFVPLFVFIVSPLVALGLLFFLGHPQPRRRAITIAFVLPLLTLLIFGVEPIWRVSHRVDDRNLQARLVQGNNVELIWAPTGPGWPSDGVSWSEAVRRSRYLNSDGQSLADTPQDIWRLPTAEEIVRSLNRHGQHAGGVWDPATRRGSFQITPDKESPLWDTNSKVIYWWSATEVDADHALRIAYNGHAMSLPKKARFGYLAFRAVKEER